MSRSTISKLGNALPFFQEVFREFQHTGTICPSSRWAAQALSSPVSTLKQPKKILELGPGTGSVTVNILEQMGHKDTLTICEINPRFMQMVKKRLSTDQHYLLHKERVSFFEGPAQELPIPEEPYDIIICALPFLNFDKPTAESIFNRLLDISHNETIMTYFEYVGLRHIGKLLAAPKRRQNLKEIEDFFSQQTLPRKIKKQRVWLNVSPIDIYTLKMFS